MLASFQCLLEKIRLKEQTKTPLSLGKRRRFRDDGEVKHSTSPAGREALGDDGSIRRLPAPRVGVILSSTALWT